MRGAKGEERREKVERMQFEEFKERERERGGGGGYPVVPCRFMFAHKTNMEEMRERREAVCLFEKKVWLLGLTTPHLTRDPKLMCLLL